ALNGAWAQVALGEMDVALVLGMEKMFSEDKAKSMAIFNAAMDVEILTNIAAAMKASETKAEKEREAGGAEKKNLTNQVGKRQVEGAKMGLAQNAGGAAPKGEGALSVTILKA
ncbi:MAG: hypothetical protein HOB38_10475, partial [Deltaproteobacteria bacterium]|nr:hypothetical protein [Deltaproteobacteria bacterium]